MNKYNKFNNWLGDKLAYGLSTMEAFYIVSAFVLIPLLFQRPNDLVGWIQYIVQSFFQGAALPVLAYVSKIQGDRQEKVLRDTHDNSMQELQKQNEEFQNIKDMMELLTNEVSLQKDETTELHSIIQDLTLILHKLHIKEGENK